MPRQVAARHGFDLDGLQHLAPHLFVVGRRHPGDYPFRLTGELVRDLHGRRLLGEDMTGLFTLTGRIELRPALEAARRGRASLIAVATARTLDGHAAPFELAFAPLRGPEGDIDRFIGLYQPLKPLARLHDARIADFALTSLHLGENDGPRLRLAALDGRLIA